MVVFVEAPFTLQNVELYSVQYTGSKESSMFYLNIYNFLCIKNEAFEPLKMGFHLGQ